MRKLIGVLLPILAWTAFLSPPRAGAVEFKETTSLPPAFAGKPSGAMAKADAALRQLFGEFQARAARGDKRPFAPSNTGLQYAPGRVAIDAVAADDPGRLLGSLEQLGLTNGAQYGRVVSGLFPIGLIDRLVALDELRAVSASWRPLTNQGDVESEGVIAMRADLVHNGVPPFTGAGVTVGVMSDSYDQQNGAAADVASGDLPAGVNVLNDSANCGSLLAPAACTDEGRGMLQIVHDVAPGATLAFHTAFGGEAVFASGIQDLCDAGADVIVDDVIYFAEPMFQDGIVAQAVDSAVAQGCTYFSAAGNAARRSYESQFVDSGEPLYVEVCLLPGFCMGTEYRGQLHDFDPGPGVDWSQDLTVPAGRTVIVTMQWDQPSSAVSALGSQSDVDIYLGKDGVIFTSSVADNISSGVPSETVVYTNEGDVDEVIEVIIAHFDGPEANPVKTVIFGGGSTLTMQYSTNSATSYGHANAVSAIPVCASFWQETPEFGVAPPAKEWFSAAGGVPNKFAKNGQRVADSYRWTPLVCAPDGVNTTFFYADTTLDADEWPNFFGTSAAAPHAAAVAALMLEADPSAPPAEIDGALRASAMDMFGTSGFDYDTGFGFIMAPDAVAAVLAMNGAPPDPGPAPEPDPDPGSNQPPSVTVAGPADGSVFEQGVSVAFSGSASDVEDGDVSASLVWTSNLDDEIGTGGSFSIATLSVGDHIVTATATDQDLATGSAVIGITVLAPNAAPVVAISSPADGAGFAFGEAVTFTGTATDDRDGDLTASLVWKDGLGQQIGTGGSFTIDNLDAGSHTIVASAVDGNGAAGVKSVNIAVAPNNLPVVTIASPADGAIFTAGDVVTVSGSASDVEDGDLTDGLTWADGDGQQIGTGGSFPYGPLAAGTYTIIATAVDSAGEAGLKAVNITVNDPPPASNTAPTVEAGVYDGPYVLTDSLVFVPLDATVIDDDGDNLTVTWSVLSGPRKANAGFTDAAAVDTTFVTDKAGTYELLLTVSDGVDTVTDTAVITVEKPPKAGGGGGGGGNCPPKKAGCA